MVKSFEELLADRTKKIPTMKSTYIPIGWDVKNKEPAFIDFSDAENPRRILICAPPNVGKSFFLHRLADYLRKMGVLVFVFHDPHREWTQKHAPNPEYYTQLRNEMEWAGISDEDMFRPFEETPEGWATGSFVATSPEFAPVAGTTVFSLSLLSLSLKNWRTLLGIAYHHRDRWSALKMLYKFFKYHKERGNMIKWDSRFQSAILSDPGYLATTHEDKENIKANMAAYQKELERFYEDYIEPRVIEGKNTQEFQDIIKIDGEVQDFTFSTGEYEYGLTMKSEYDKELYMVAMILKILEYGMKGGGYEVYAIGDEMQKVLTGHKDEGTTKISDPAKALQYIFTEGRKFGIGCVLVFQVGMEHVPQKIKDTADLLIVYGKASTKYLTELERRKPEIFRTLDEAEFTDVGPHDFWLIDNRNTVRPIKKIISYPPRSKQNKIKWDNTRKRRES